MELLFLLTWASTRPRKTILLYKRGHGSLLKTKHTYIEIPIIQLISPDYSLFFSIQGFIHPLKPPCPYFHFIIPIFFSQTHASKSGLGIVVRPRKLLNSKRSSKLSQEPEEKLPRLRRFSQDERPVSRSLLHFLATLKRSSFLFHMLHYYFSNTERTERQRPSSKKEEAKKAKGQREEGFPRPWCRTNTRTYTQTELPDQSRRKNIEEERSWEPKRDSSPSSLLCLSYYLPLSLCSSSSSKSSFPYKFLRYEGQK